MKTEFPYAEAKDIADKIVDRLSLFTKVIHIAGSVRRQSAVCGDIEICLLPQTIRTNTGGLFEDKFTEIVSPLFAEALRLLGKPVKGQFDGNMMQILLPEGIMLDLFMPHHYDYYRQLAIRTGSKDYSWKIIAAGWVKIGWVGSDMGLRLRTDCINKETPDGKGKWLCLDPHAEKPPVWNSEEEFFSWLNIEWVEPKYRKI